MVRLVLLLLLLQLAWTAHGGGCSSIKQGGCYSPLFPENNNGLLEELAKCCDNKQNCLEEGIDCGGPCNNQCPVPVPEPCDLVEGECVNPPYFVPEEAPTWNFFAGNDGFYEISAEDLDVDQTVAVISTLLPEGATFVKNAEQPDGENPVYYTFRWTPAVDSVSVTACFQAKDCAGIPNVGGNYCVRCAIGAGDIIWMTGVIRDFQSSHADFSIADGDDGVPFVKEVLGLDGKPELDLAYFTNCGGSCATTTSEATFYEWFNDVEGVNLPLTYSLVLNNASSPDWRIYTTDMSNFFPIDEQLFGNEGSDHNYFFTYELHGYMTYIGEGLIFEFRAADDYWVYINSKLPIGWDLSGVHAPKTFTLNFDEQITHFGTTDEPLTIGETYRFDVFFAHRSSSRPPDMKIEAPKGLLCNAVYSGVTEFDFVTIDQNAQDQIFTAGATFAESDTPNVVDALQLVDTGGGSEIGAAYYGTSEVPELLKVLPGFRTEFEFRTTGPNCEGFAFHLHSSTRFRSTISAYSLGYEGVDHSLAIEFDMFYNGAEYDPFDATLGAYQHVSLHTMEDLENTAKHGVTTFPLSNNNPVLTMNNGSWHKVAIEYLPPREADVGGQGQLTVTIGEVIVPILTVLLDPLDFLNGAAYVGFTSSTQASNPDTVLIRDWSLITVPPSASQTSLVSPPATFPAGTTSTVTIQAKDACGNNIKVGGEAARFSAYLENSYGDLEEDFGTVEDIGDGLYLVSYTRTRSGYARLRITFDGIAIASSPWDVFVTAGALDPWNSMIMVSETAVRYDMASGNERVLAYQFSPEGDLKGISQFDFMTGAASVADDFYNFCNAVPDGDIISIAVARDASGLWSSAAADGIALLGGRLTSLEAHGDYGESYCLIGVKGESTVSPNLNPYETVSCGEGGVDPCNGVGIRTGQIERYFDGVANPFTVYCDSAGENLGTYGAYARIFTHHDQINLVTRDEDTFHVIARDSLDNWLNVVSGISWGISFQATSGSDVGNYTLSNFEPGVTDIDYSTAVASSYQLVVSNEGLTVNQVGLLFDVKPGAAYGPACSVLGSGEATGLTGAEAGVLATFYVRLFDEDLNRVTDIDFNGDQVDFSVLTDDGDNVVNIDPVWNEELKDFELTYTATVSNDGESGLPAYHFDITVNGDPVTAANSYFPVVVAGPVDPAQCLADIDTLSGEMVAGDETFFYIYSRDQYQNDRQVSNGEYGDYVVTGTVDGVEVFSVVGINEFGGLYSALFSYDGAYDEVEVSIELDGTLIGFPAENPTTLLCVPNLPSSDTSFVSAPGVFTATAGEIQVVDFTSVDAYGNTRSLYYDDRVYFVPDIKKTSGATETAFAEMVCNNDVCPSDDGSYTINWNATVKGTYAINLITSVSIGGDEVVDSGTYEVVITPGVTSKAYTTGDGTNGGLIGYRVKFNINAQDRFGNLQDHQNDEFRVLFTWPEGLGETYTTTTTAETQAAYTVKAISNGVYTVDYEVLDSMDPNSNFGITVYLVDNEELIEFLYFDAIGIDSNLFCYATICTDYADAAQNDGAACGVSADLGTVKAGKLTTLHVVDLDSGGSLKAGRDGATYFVVTFFDDNDDVQNWGSLTLPKDEVVSLYNTTFTPTVTGQFSLNVSEYGAIISENAPWTIEVLPGEPNGPTSVVETGLPVTDLSAGTTQDYTVLLKDQFGNEILDEAEDGVFLTIKLMPDNIVIVDNEAATFNGGTSRWEGDFSLTASTSVSTYYVAFVTVGPYTGSGDDVIVEVQSGFTVLVTAGDPHGPNCYICDTGDCEYPDNIISTGSISAGVEGYVDVYVVDVYGNPCEQVSLPWDLSFDNEASLSYVKLQQFVNVWRIKFSSTVAGTQSLSIVLDTDPIQDNPFDITVDPSNLDYSQSSAVFDFESLVAASSITFSLSTRDQYGNDWLDDQDIRVTGCHGYCWIDGTSVGLAPATVVSRSDGTGIYDITFPGGSTHIAGVYSFEVRDPRGNPFYLLDIDDANSAVILTNLTTIVAGPTDPYMTLLPQQLNSTVVDIQSAYTLYTRDQYGNIRLGATDDDVEVTFRVGQSLCISEDELAEGNSHTIGGPANFAYEPVVPGSEDGYIFSFLPFEQGIFTINVTVNGVILECDQSTLLLIVNAGAVSPLFSYFTVADKSIACDTTNPFPASGCTINNGNKLDVALYLSDKYGNSVIRGLEDLDGTIEVGTAFDYEVDDKYEIVPATTVPMYEVVTDVDFTVKFADYDAVNAIQHIYLSTPVADTYSLVLVLVQADGNRTLLHAEQVQAELSTILVAAATPVSFSFDQAGLEAEITAALPLSFQVQTLDVYGNEVQTEADGGYSYSISFSGRDLNYFFECDPVFIGPGLVNVDVLSVWHGEYDMTIKLSNPDYEASRTSAEPQTKLLTSVVTISHATCGFEFPDNPFRCPDRACESKYSDCSDIVDNCSNYECASSSNVTFFPATECESAFEDCSCPAGLTRCPTIDVCVSDIDLYCLEPPQCPNDAPYQCSDGTCRLTADDCPSEVRCPSGTVLCSNGLSCARADNWAAECSELTEVPVCGASMLQCPDGHCVRYFEDCATKKTCPIDTVLCPDGSCADDENQCPNQYECFNGDEEDRYRCVDGSCRTSFEQCPSAVTCPVGYVKCENEECAPSLSKCGTALDCGIDRVRCADGSCKHNMMLCPSMVTCSVDYPVLCADGSCAEMLSGCPMPTQCDSSLQTCPDGSCNTVGLPCPTTKTCPSDYPVLCSDGGCVASPEDCSIVERCPVEAPVRCPSGACRGNLLDCPTTRSCPDDAPLMCADGKCVVSQADCPDVALLLCAEDEVRCPGGECAVALALCPTHTTCPIGTIKCLDGTCRTECPSSSQVCSADEVQCPRAGVGVTCRASLDLCSTSMICPAGLPVKCLDATCAATIDDCPPAPTDYVDNKIACADGVWTTDLSTCGTPVSCPADFPYKCYDETCRVAPEDCPVPTACPSGEYLCPTGSCVDRLWASSCTPVLAPCASGLVKCMTGECVNSVDECPSLYFEVEVDPTTGETATNDIYYCPEGVARCRDGACKSDPNRCEDLKCPEFIPFRCDDGLCTDSEEHCNFENGCPWHSKVKCWDGACAAELEDCTVKTTFCPTGEVDCPDGSCRSDFSLCPSSNGCEKSEMLCHDKTCVSASSSDNLCVIGDSTGNSCPGGRPYQCNSGYCSVSSIACPVIPDNNCDIDLPVSCASGDCVATSSQCPLVKPCLDGEFRCDDGTCREKESYCPRHNSCPLDAPYRCKDTGICAAGAESCIDPWSGCPLNLNYKCINGDCVESEEYCVDIPSNGCPVNATYKCYNGACEASEDDCLEVNGCPQSEPFKCTVDGSCESLPALCPEEKAEELIYKCADGVWVEDPTTCLTSNGCPVLEPIRCQNGECATYAADAYDRVSEGDSICELSVACQEGETLCADGSCVSHSSLCSPADVCDGYRCPDLSCKASEEECGTGTPECPTEAPVLCETGVCKEVPELCPDGLDNYGEPTSTTTGDTTQEVDENGEAVTTEDGFEDNGCPSSTPVLCFEGSCFATYADCVEWTELIQCGVDGSLCPDVVPPSSSSPSSWVDLDGDGEVDEPYIVSTGIDADSNADSTVEDSLTGQWCTNGDILCADGTCRPIEMCPSVPPCPKGRSRCWDGSCVSGNTDACPEETSVCPEGTLRCEDGLCRSSCLPFDGCPIAEAFHCDNRECARADAYCYIAIEGEPNTGLSYTSRRLLMHEGEPHPCQDDCNAAEKALYTTYSVDFNVNYEFSIAFDSSLVEIAHLTMPSGSVIARQSDDNTTFADTAVFEIRPVADSRMLYVENQVDGTRVDEFGYYMTYPQTLLSPAFECLVGQDVVEPFPVPIVFEASIDMDRDPDYNDICLATLYEVDHSSGFNFQTWRCLEQGEVARLENPVRDPDSTEPAHKVRFPISECGTDGAVYGFIHAPMPVVIEDNSFFDWTSENVLYFLLILMFGGTIFLIIVYFCSRLIRFRKKYKDRANKNAQMGEDVTEMEQHGGKFGRKDDEVIFVENPLQMQMNDMQKEVTLEDIELEEAKAQARRDQAAVRKAHIAVMQAEREKLKKEFDLLKQQLDTLENSNKPAKKKVHHKQGSMGFGSIGATGRTNTEEEKGAIVSEFEQVAPTRRKRKGSDSDSD